MNEVNKFGWIVMLPKKKQGVGGNCKVNTIKIRGG